jgi:tRNA nucleotidyltransferase (CCA-adding enzyme)
MNISKNIINKIKKEGGKIYLVGGAVRDKLLNKEPTDYDYCITGLTKDKFESLFPKVELVGKDFPVYLLNGNEIAFARIERKSGKGYKGFEIDFNPNINIKNDLKRRDLTINSMAINLHNNKLIDPFNGEKDLNNGIIKATSNTFKEDPLRVYRVVRFAAKLNFNINNKTLELMKSLKNELKTLLPERVFEELKKILLTNNSSVAFEYLAKTNLLEVHFKELKQLINIPQVKKYHPEGDVFKHTMLVLDEITKYTKEFKNDKKVLLRYAALMHDIGKGLTESSKLPHHYKHNKLGINILEEIKKDNNYTIPKKWFKVTKLIIKQHMRVIYWQKMKPGKVVRLFNYIKNSPLTVKDFMLIIKADKKGRGTNRKFENKYYRFIDLYRKMYEETGGENINSEKYQGKKFGEMLFQYRCRWIKQERKNYGRW